MSQKIIIDTDPWVDDALAIMYAIKNWCNIDWITTVFWNADIDNTTKNTLKILSIMWKNIPVFKGLEKPIKVENTFAMLRTHSFVPKFLPYLINLLKTANH